MHREPIGLYFLRLSLTAALLGLASMLYWSSTLVEKSLLKVQADLVSLKKELTDLSTNIKHFRGREEALIDQGLAKTDLEKRGAMDYSLPNLLQEDPFYQKTLPELLGKEFFPHGAFHYATLGRPQNLHPFSNWNDVNQWINLCVGSIASGQFGKYETVSPDLAIKMEARPFDEDGNVEYWVHLRDGIFWHPLSEALFSDQVQLAPHFLHRHPVTAHDFKFYYDAMMNPFVQEPGAIAMRTLFADMEPLHVIDNQTLVVRWKRRPFQEADGKTVLKTKYVAKLLTGGLKPLPSFIYKYFSDGSKILSDDRDPDIYRNDPVWAQNFAEHWAKNIIVSCGPWLFNGMSDMDIQFQRNPGYHNSMAALAESIVYKIKNSPDTIWQDFKIGESETYILRPEQQIELEQFLKSEMYRDQEARGLGIKQLDYISRLYAYIGWNEAAPYFSSKKVRQAMTMAIDRQRIIEQNLNGMGIEITGPFYVYSTSYDHAIRPWPFNPEKAKQILEEEGWYDSDGDGFIDKEIDGRRMPFRFTLTYYVKNPTSKAICDYVVTALRQIGIDCRPKGVDVTDLSAEFDDKSFDALLLAWTSGSPPEDPRQLWHSSGAKEFGSSNAIGFSNPEIDQLIDQLDFESNPKKREELYHHFHAIIHEEAPYTFLYTPKSRLLYRAFVQNVFIPADRQDIVPGANIGEPQNNIFWLEDPQKSTR